jgi:phage regulator Rha-like protein
MFQLTIDEYANLRSQFVTSNRGGRRYMPFAFTEHGAVMLASVLKSKRAIQMSIEVVKAFVRLRGILSSQKNIEKQLVEIRSFMLKQTNKTDREFKKVWKAIEDLTNPSENQSNNPIGFKIDNV